MNGELRVEDEPRLEEVAALEDRLHQHNVAVTGCGDGRWLAIFVRDGTGEVMAGLHGWTWGRTGFVKTLWVREDLRGRGLGARLLAAAEREATRDCTDVSPRRLEPLIMRGINLDCALEGHLSVQPAPCAIGRANARAAAGDNVDHGFLIADSPSLPGGPSQRGRRSPDPPALRGDGRLGRRG